MRYARKQPRPSSVGRVQVRTTSRRPPRVLRRESSRLSKLHAPQTSQAGLTRFAEEIRELSVIYKGLKNQSLQAFKQISLKTQKPGNIAMRIAHQLGASACVLQASGRAK